MAQKTYYEILQVPEDAETVDIRKAYRIRAAECHPDKVMHLDRSVQDEARHKMVLINEAYQVLNDPTKRRDYDEYIRMIREKRSERAASAAASAPSGAAGAAAAPPPVPPPATGSSSPQAPPPPGAGPTTSAAAPPANAPPPPPSSPGPAAASASEPATEPEGPPARPERPYKPPPEPGQDELLKALQTALAEVERIVREANGDVTWRTVEAGDFDLALQGSKELERYGCYATSVESLSAEQVDGHLAQLAEVSAVGRSALQRRYNTLLILCLALEDPAAVRAAVRERNQTALATLARKRGETTMCGYLHLPSGELYAPYLRTIRPDFRRLREVCGLY